MAESIRRIASPARVALGILLVLCSAPWARGDVYGHWPLDDGQGNIARDLGPRMEDATIFDFDVDGLGENGSVWVNDPERGTVLGLGGNTAWVSAGFLPLMDLENDFSWSFWARQHPDQLSPANDIVVGNRYDEAGVDTVPREFIKFTPDRFEYHMNGGARSNDLPYDNLNAIPSNDQWIHHSLVKDGDTLTYYRNGEFGNSNTITQGQASAFPLPYAFGGQHDGETWRGYLSDVQLYASAVTQEDIQNTIMSGASLDNADLYARYTLDDGSGDIASSTGSNPGFGTIFNAATGGLGPEGSVWVEDPERGTVLGLADTAWVDAGELPIMTLEQDFTWAFWARQDPEQPSPNNDIIIGNRWDVGAQVDTLPPEWIKFTPSRFEFHMNGTAEGDVTYEEGQLGIPSNDEWINHILVKDGDHLAYYRNGELENERTILDPMLSPDPLPFGLGGQNGLETWQGYLSDVRLFDHALSSGEIAELSGGDVTGAAGDYNGNGLVEQQDLDLVLAHWGDDAAVPPAGWINDPPEGNIDQTELDSVLVNWGNTAALGAHAAVPEPTTLALVAIGLAFLTCVRRNGRLRTDVRTA